MKRYKDLSGQKFNHLTVNKTFSRLTNGLFVSYSKCLCECGNIIILRSSNIVRGRSISCGCLHKNTLDLRGKRFGRWIAIKHITGRNGQDGRWLCQCDCGTEKTIVTWTLTSGQSQSCGCLRDFLTKNYPANKVHGKSDHYLFNTWEGIKRRCYNPTDPAFKYYGGRKSKPIKLFHNWINSFQSFYDYIIMTLGERPTKKHTLDRCDNSKGYRPGNLRWATWTQQARNTRKNILVEYNNTNMVLSELSEKTGRPYMLLYNRICNLNWNVDRAVSKPVDMRFGPRKNK